MKRRPTAAVDVRPANLRCDMGPRRWISAVLYAPGPIGMIRKHVGNI
jgi:hypothetical protein